MNKKSFLTKSIAAVMSLIMLFSLLPAEASLWTVGKAVAEPAEAVLNSETNDIQSELPQEQAELQTSIPAEELITISSVAEQFKVERDWVAAEMTKGYKLNDIYQALAKKQSGGDYQAYLDEKYPNRELTEYEVYEQEVKEFKKKTSSQKPVLPKVSNRGSASLQSNYYDDIAIKRAKLGFDQAPYSVGNEDEGQISTVDGSLTIRHTDLVLPGPNGLDFPLTRIYNSNKGKDDIYFDYTQFRNATVTPIDDLRFPLGKGWSWDISHMTFTNDGPTIMYVAGLGSFTVSSNSISGLAGIPSVYMSFGDANGESEGARYKLANYKDGTIEYFDASGLLIEKRDEFGNKIYFVYNDANSYWVKTLSMVITATADNSEQNYLLINYNGKTSITAKIEDRVVTYKKSVSPVDSNGTRRELLTEVVDPMGRSTKYTYAQHNMLLFNFIDSYRYYTGDMKMVYWGKQDWTFLTSIEHPSKAVTVLGAGKGETNIGPTAVETTVRYAWKDTSYSSASLYEYRGVSTGFSGNYMGSYGSDAYFDVPITEGLYKTVYSYKRKFRNGIEPDAFYLIRKVTSPVNDPSRQQVSTYTYDEPSKILDPISVTEYGIGESGLISSKTKRQTFDSFGLVASVTDERGITTTYNNWLVSSKNRLAPTEVVMNKGSAGKVITTNTYDFSNGSLIKSVVKDDKGVIQQEVNYKYDKNGKVIETVLTADGKKVAVNQKYTRAAEFLNTEQSVKTTSVDGQAQTITLKASYVLSTGLMSSFTDGNGYTTQYRYDKLGRPLEEINPDGTKTTAVYTDTLNKISVTDPTGTQSNKIFTPFGHLASVTTPKGTVQYAYDSYERLAQITGVNGSKTTYAYDVWSRKVSEETGQSKTMYAYDDNNLTVTTTDGEGNSIRKAFDNLDRPIREQELKPSGTVTLNTYAYDTVGNLSSVTDALNKKTSYTYDLFDQLTSITDPLGQKTSYTYDKLGNTNALTYADGKQMKYEYDEIGRLLRQTDPLGQVETFAYDGAGNLVKYVDRKGQERSYLYNNRGFLKEDRTADETIQYLYDAAGRRTQMTDATGKTTYRYTAVGELENTTYPDGSMLDMQYEARGLRSSQTFKSGDFSLSIQQSYNASLPTLNSLNVTQADGSSSSSGSYTYDYRKNNMLSKVTTSSGQTETYTYDGLNLSNLTQTQNGATFGSYAYSYDNNRNIVSKTDNDKTYTFGYDALNRLQTSSLFNENYAYDPRGNRSQMTTERQPDFSEADYTYDRRDRLVEVKTENGTVSYRYNGDGLMTERIGTDGAKTRYYYDDRALLVAEGKIETTGSIKITVGYVYDANGKLRGRQIPGENGIQTYWTNAHGDVTEIRNAAGETLNRYTYDVWGNPIIEEETVDNVMRYSGEYWDRETGLQYLRARWYDPNIGRFINEDTYEGEKDKPATLNLYSYVENDPIRYVDSSGNIKRNATYSAEGGSGGLSGGSSRGPTGNGPQFGGPLPRTNNTGDARSSGSAAWVEKPYTSRINIAEYNTRFTPLRPRSNNPVSAGWKHVREGHFDRALTNNISVFSISKSTLKKILQSPNVIKANVTDLKDGHYVRIVDTGMVVGHTSLRYGGKETTWIKVFTDKAGNLITVYPVPALK